MKKSSRKCCNLRTRRPWVFTLLLAIVLAISGAGCKTPPEVIRADQEIERNVAVAHGAYAAGDLAKAVIYYQKALQRARVIDSPSGIIRNAYNLAACLAALRSYDAAQAYLDEARLEVEHSGIPCPELPLLEAKIARAQGQFQEAEDLARTELKKHKALNADIQVQWLLLKAELKCDQDQAAAAEIELTAIAPRQLQACRAEIKAETALTRAHIEMRKHSLTEAARQYDMAAAYWRSARRYGDMAAALDQAAHAYEAAGNNSAAADRCYRAARSLFESGQTEQARDLAARALRLATAAKQESLQRQAERLKAEV
ncbi:MAG: hypothetical protein HYV36_00760 [Lentisphaerae bacterium]|nr:hypothetical protein [Lentisphaerota bacterium]